MLEFYLSNGKKEVFFKLHVPEAQLQQDIMVILSQRIPQARMAGYDERHPKGDFESNFDLKNYKLPYEYHIVDVNPDKVSSKTIAALLAHELGHVQQWEEKILKPYVKGDSKQFKKACKSWDLDRNNLIDMQKSRTRESDADLRAAQMLGTAYPVINWLYPAGVRKFGADVSMWGWLVFSHPAFIVGTKKLWKAGSTGKRIGAGLLGTVGVANGLLSAAFSYCLPTGWKLQTHPSPRQRIT